MSQPYTDSWDADHQWEQEDRPDWEHMAADGSDAGPNVGDAERTISIAAGLGLTVDALRMRLNRIDVRLADALAVGLLTGTPSPQAAKELTASARHRASTRAGLAASAGTPVAAVS